MSLEPGTLLAERYIIQKSLGEGGMGAVYLAKDLKFAEKYWAIKELYNPFQEADIRRRAIAQFEEEANILASLNHPNLPAVSDHFSENDSHYLVMEYIKGSALVDVIMENTSSISDILEWSIKLCDVLYYLHTRKPKPVIFRDLKPDNIMLTSDGVIKLIDFGISKVFDEEKATGTFIQSCGTSGYAPPEQYTAGTDFRSDIYSLGATIYTLTTGNVPPDALSILVDGVPLASPSELNMDISAHLEEIILKSMSLKKEERYGDIVEMKEALTLCYDEYENSEEEEPSEPAVITENLPEAKMPVSKGNSKIIALIILLTVISGAIIYFLLFSGTKIPSDMVFIPECEFLMGKENRKVYLKAFYIDKFEVSNKEYKKFIDATDYTAPVITDEMVKRYNWSENQKNDMVKKYNWNGHNFPDGRGDYPVVLVNKEDAENYAKWIKKRLPTEAEWEKACRGTEGHLFPWGTVWDKTRCNIMDSRIMDTVNVSLYKNGKSPYDVYNMLGNVWEWTSTQYGQSFIIKGGGWARPVEMADSPFYSYEQQKVSPFEKTPHLGFRCCLSK